MNDITQAIDPDATRHGWERRYEYHLALIPALLRTALNMATAHAEPHIPVSRGGSQFDRPQITGGGYYDQAPVMLGTNDRAAGDATYLWSLLAEYASAVSEWLGADTRIPATCPATPQGAHDAALLIIGTLIEHASDVWPHRQLDTFEGEMFAEIRSQQRRMLPTFDGLPQHARVCVTCGETAVRVVWVDGANGSPRPVQVGKCRVCGETYRQNEGDAS